VSHAQRTFTLTADDAGNALLQANVGLVEVIAVTFDAGTLGAATLEVSEADAPFLTIDTEGVYYPSIPMSDDTGDTTVGYRAPFTLSGFLFLGLSGATPAGVGTVTVAYRR